MIQGRLRSIIVSVSIVALVAAACGSPATLLPSTDGARPTASPGVAHPTASPGAGAAGPFGDVPMYRMDTQRSGVQPGPGPVAAPVVVWARKAPAGVAFASTLADGTLFVGTEDGHLYALKAGTGETRWVFDAGSPLHFSSVADGGLVFVVSDDHILHAVDIATGNERWRKSAARSADGATGGVVYISGSDHYARGYDETTGTEQWKWLAPNDIYGMSVLDGRAYVNVTGALDVIDVATAKEQCSFPVVGQSASVPMVTADSVVIASQQGAGSPVGELEVLDRATCSVRWLFREPSGSSISTGAIRDGILYVRTENQDSNAFSMKDGKQVWSGQDTGEPVYTPALVGRVLYSPTADLGIVAVSAIDGTKLWSVKTPGDLKSWLVVSGGLVFAADSAGEIRAYGEASLAGPGGPVTVATPLDNTGVASSATPPPNPFRITATLPASLTGIHTAEALALGPDGNIYALDDRPRVSVIAPDGRLLRSWGRKGTHAGELDLDHQVGIGGPAIAIGPDGLVYVSDLGNHRVQVFRPDGTFVRQFGSFGTGDGQFESPYQTGIDAQGNVYVIDAGSLTLTKWDNAGHFLWRAGHGLPAGNNHAFGHGAIFDSLGHLWFIDDATGIPFATTVDGAVADSFGTAGPSLGQLDDACTIGFDHAGHTFIWDCSAPRIQAFNAKHQLVGAWVTVNPHPIRAMFVVTPAGGIVALGADDSILEISVDLPPG